MSLKYYLPLLCLSICCQSPDASAFTADEFDDGTLGSQWTTHDSAPPGSTFTEVDGHFVIEGAVGSDLYFPVDTHAFIEQDAPEGTNWEIITKIDGFDPTVAGQQRQFTRVGMQLWVSDNEYIVLSSLSNADGTVVDSQNIWQFDPALQAPVSGSNLLRGQTQLNNWPPDYSGSIWMKLQSTSRGYRGYIATGSGNNWTECLNIVRNPNTDSGLLENAKIRLFDAGGFYHVNGQRSEEGTQAGTPAKFDFIRMNSLPDPTMDYTDDEFEGTELAPNWQEHHGIAGGFISLDSGELVLTGGVYSDMWGHIEQPAFIFQDAPTSASYAISMKGSPLLMTEIPYELWNSYGIWLWKDQCNWIFISNQRGVENPAQPSTSPPNNRIETAVKYDNHFYTGAVSFGTGSTPAYLRVVRDGSNARVEYSTDNSTWTTFAFNVEGTPTTDFPIGSDKMQVRLFTKRAAGDGPDGDGQNNPPMDGRFDWIRSEAITSEVSTWELY